MQNMNPLFKKALDKLDAKAYRFVRSFFPKQPPQVQATPFASRRKLLIDTLQAGKPAMIVRFGSTEMGAFFEHEVSQLPFWQRHKTRIIFNRWNSLYLKSEHSMFQPLCCLSGFFPEDRRLLGRYAEMIKQDAPLIDILGAWLAEENYFNELLPHEKKVHLLNLDPLFNRDSNFLSGLEGKRVLVIHPFVETIQKQYLKRQLLFPTPDFLPAFKLLTLKAVQSVAYEKTAFKDWFEALDFMKNEMAKFEFDIAIIGCGAYGMHLAAHAKRMGKIGLHLGGNVQRLFGIHGKRWDEREHYYIKPNQHWIKPSQEETPKNAHLVEDACYW